jgi:hypothetical protein
MDVPIIPELDFDQLRHSTPWPNSGPSRRLERRILRELKVR